MNSTEIELDPTAMEPRKSRRIKRLRPLVVVIIVVFATGILGWWAGRQSVSTSKLAKINAAPQNAVVTEPVVLKLLQSTVSSTGTVTTASQVAVNFGTENIPNAVSIYTADGPKVGSTVTAGSVIAEIAGRPVFALQGFTPMYRQLSDQTTGPDVQELQSSLRSLGYKDGDSPGVYGSSTEAAMRKFYSDRGYSIEQASPSSTSISSLPTDTSTSTLLPSPLTSTGTIAQELPIVPQAEIVFLPSLPATVISTSESLGGSISNPAMTLGYGSPIVNLIVTTAQASEISAGDSAEIFPETATTNNQPLSGTVTSIQQATANPNSSNGSNLAPSNNASTNTAIGSSQQSVPNSSSNSSGSGSSVGGTSIGGSPLGTSQLNSEQAIAEINLTGQTPPIATNVSVSITVASTPKPVLAVPVGALFTSSDGSTDVTVIEGKSQSNIKVNTGPSIGGYVAVTPVQGNLIAGMRVWISDNASN